MYMASALACSSEVANYAAWPSNYQFCLMGTEWKELLYSSSN